MAPVIWGLDLAEIKFSKFKSSEMWSREYHLRRIKFIIYQCAMIFSVVSESLGTAALSDYVDAQGYVDHLDFGVHTNNNDYVGAASFNIFAGVFTATIFGAGFFFDLFWPERKESRAVRIAWKVCGVLACVFLCGAAFSLTIITATHCAYFTGSDAEAGYRLLHQFHKDGGAPLCYRKDGRAVAAVVFIWPGFLFTIASCVLLFMSINHTESGPGPKTKHAREREAAAREAEAGLSIDPEKDGAEKMGESGRVHDHPEHDVGGAAAPVAEEAQ